jgi:hypothetical protein
VRKEEPRLELFIADDGRTKLLRWRRSKSLIQFHNFNVNKFDKVYTDIKVIAMVGFSAPLNANAAKPV